MLSFDDNSDDSDAKENVRAREALRETHAFELQTFVETQAEERAVLKRDCLARNFSKAKLAIRTLVERRRVRPLVDTASLLERQVAITLALTRVDQGPLFFSCTGFNGMLLNLGGAEVVPAESGQSRGPSAWGPSVKPIQIRRQRG
jgi:hypothetical protein